MSEPDTIELARDCLALLERLRQAEPWMDAWAVESSSLARKMLRQTARALDADTMPPRWRAR